MFFTSSVILFVCITYINRFPAQVLTVHRVYCCVGAIKIIVTNKSISLRNSRLRVSHYLRTEYDTKRTKYISQHFLIDSLIDVPNEYVSTDLLSPLILSGLIYLNRFSEALDHVQYLYGIISVLLGLELHESVALMLISDLIPGYVNIDYGSTLQEKLPNQVFIHL